MSSPPYQWCANTGYHPPNPSTPPVKMYCFQGQPFFLPHHQPPVTYVQAPMPPYGVFQYGPYLYLGYPAPTYKKFCVPPPPIVDSKKSGQAATKTSVKDNDPPKVDPKEETTEEGEKNDTKDKDEKPASTKEDKPSASAQVSSAQSHNATVLPLSLRAGVNYMFPREHTRLHILCKATRAWEKKYDSSKFRFNIYKVSTHLTVKEVIQNTMNTKVQGDWEKCQGWAATEIIECGDGKWEKGSTIEYSSDKSDGTLASMGWSSKRGSALPPVWLTVHKVETEKK